ncbi:MAG: squalene/phytoene synthase family protein [bacterium]
MSRWKLNVFALFLLFDTFARSAWRRKDKGLRGLVCYPWFLFQYFIQMLIGFFLLTWRVTIILSFYAWFRRIDDVMDEDADPPRGYTRKSYLAQKQKVIASLPNLDNCSSSLLTEDLLLVFLLRESDYYKINIVKEITDLWTVMCWDNERQKNVTIATREEMFYYARSQDNLILGICVKVFGGDAQRFHELSSFSTGIFTRIDWLSDLDNDLRKGIVNIPLEVFEEHSLKLSQLLACKSWEELWIVPGFSSWYTEEIGMLGKLWVNMRTELGQNFGGIFSSRFLTFVFQKLVVKEFERAFKKSFSRIFI